MSKTFDWGSWFAGGQFAALAVVVVEMLGAGEWHWSTAATVFIVAFALRIGVWSAKAVTATTAEEVEKVLR